MIMHYGTRTFSVPLLNKIVAHTKVNPIQMIIKYIVHEIETWYRKIMNNYSFRLYK